VIALPGLRDLCNAVRVEADKRQARAWRAITLPAGTEVPGVEPQVGALGREVCLPAPELERARPRARR
jgi:hypothetical protein